MALRLPDIPPPDARARDTARQRQETLTKPAGSLGRLEELSLLLAAAQGRSRPSVARRAVVVMAADHGVAGEGVSAFPASVTQQMVLNFLRGGAAVNVLSRQAGARIRVVDVGVAADFDSHPHLDVCKVARGTRNFFLEPAMTVTEAEAAVRVGLEIAASEATAGCDLLATGEMGIANTTASAAVVAALCNLPAAAVTGRGTGLGDAALFRKIAVIETALTRHQPNRSDPLDVLAKVGGLEIGALAGLIIGAASRRVPVLLDGFITGAAALLAAAMKPDVRPYLIAAHRSVEPGHSILLERLGLQPLLELNMRLGEGSGAVLAMHLLEAATRTLDEMATFNEAGVDERSA